MRVTGLLFVILIYIAILLGISNVSSNFSSYKHEKYTTLEDSLIVKFSSINTRLCLSSNSVHELKLILSICNSLARRKANVSVGIFHKPKTTCQYLLLLLACCGDVHPLPGPSSSNCLLCDRAGRKNQIRLICSVCSDIFHTQCLGLKYKDIKDLKAKD
jgi:hypothetical protein